MARFTFVNCEFVSFAGSKHCTAVLLQGILFCRKPSLLITDFVKSVFHTPTSDTKDDLTGPLTFAMHKDPLNVAVGTRIS